MPKGTVISWDCKGETYTMSIDHGIYYNEDGLVRFVYRDKSMQIMEETAMDVDIIPVDTKLPVSPGDKVYVSSQEDQVCLLYTSYNMHSDIIGTNYGNT